MPEQTDDRGMAVGNPPIADHPLIQDATIEFIEGNRDLEIAQNFFILHGCPYPRAEIEAYFRPLPRNLTVASVRRSKSLQKLQNDTLVSEGQGQAGFQISMVQEMAWQRIVDLHSDGSRQELETKEQRNMHKSQSKEFCDLAKCFADYHRLKLDMISMGKTEGEAKAELEAYMADLLKQTINIFADMPEAQARLSEFLNIAGGHTSSPVEDEEDEDSEDKT